MRVGSFRKAAQVPYPFEYASYEQVHSASTPERKAKLLAFNAAQRGHQNFNENHLNMVGSLLVCGLVHPKVAASLGAFWSVNRVLYAVGYTNWGKDGKGRYAGLGGNLAQYGTQIWAVVTAWGLAMK